MQHVKLGRSRLTANQYDADYSYQVHKRVDFLICDEDALNSRTKHVTCPPDPSLSLHRMRVQPNAPPSDNGVLCCPNQIPLRIHVPTLVSPRPCSV